jgi:hypothetical protein
LRWSAVTPELANVLAIILSFIAIGINVWQWRRYKKRGW